MLNATSSTHRSEYPRLLRLLVLFAFAGSALNAATAASLLTNGGFETGDFSGWSVATQGNGNWFVNTGSSSPLNAGDTVAGAAAGVFYAVTDQTRPGAYSLTQSFTVPQTTAYVELSFQMFVDNYSSRSITPTLNPDAGMPNQYARVDLLTVDASAFDTTLLTSIVATFYAGSDAGNTANPYGYYRFNLSSLVTPGNTYQIRFSNVANQGVLHQGVDAVTIIAEIPEPGSNMLFAAGIGLLLGARQYLRNRNGRGRAS